MLNMSHNVLSEIRKNLNEVVQFHKMHCAEKHERYFDYSSVFICIDYKYTEVMICTDMCHSYVLWLLSGLAHERRFSNYQIFLTFLSQVTVKLELKSLKSIYGNIKY